MKRAPTPWDAFPDARTGKMDAETCGLAAALAHPNVTLQTGALVAAAASWRPTASASKASNIAAAAKRSDRQGQARRARRRRRQIGRVAAALFRARRRQPQRHGRPPFHEPQSFRRDRDRSARGQRFRLSEDASDQRFLSRRRTRRAAARQHPVAGARQRRDPEGRSEIRRREFALRLGQPPCRRLVGDERGSAQSRKAASRSTAQASGWTGSAATGPRISRWSRDCASGCARPAIPSCCSRAFDRRTPSHQCGTVRIGADPATAPLDPYCRAWDHPNLFVVDASFLPTSAAVNPSLTIAAQALRVADHIARNDL